MLDFFDWVVETVNLLLDFVWNVIDSITTLLVTIASCVSLPTTLLGYLPGVIGSCFLTITAIAVAKLIAGR